MVRGPIPIAIVKKPPKTPRIPKDWAAVAGRRLHGAGIQVSGTAASRTAAIINSVAPAARWS
jgi:hypothetical protein